MSVAGNMPKMAEIWIDWGNPQYIIVLLMPLEKVQ